MKDQTRPLDITGVKPRSWHETQCAFAFRPISEMFMLKKLALEGDGKVQDTFYKVSIEAGLLDCLIRHICDRIQQKSYGLTGN
jgi:hypothetical protein